MKYVYMLRAGEQHYKVGMASNVVNRIKSIQTSNPSKIEVVTTNLVNNANKLEHSLHVWLAEYKTGGGREWFALTDKQALDLAIKLNNTGSVEISDFVAIQDIADKQEKLNQKFDKLIDFLDVSEGSYKHKPTIINTTQDEDRDLYNKAVELVNEQGRASTSFLQLKLRIGYGRASRIMDELEVDGFISSMDGNRPRTVYGRKKTMKESILEA